MNMAMLMLHDCLLVFIYCIQLYFTTHIVMAIITVVSVDFVIFNLFILLIVL